MQHLYDMLSSNSYEGISNITKKTLPKIGFIVFLDKTPIAAGFLRRLEPCYAQIDTLVSNKYLGALVRHEGITKIVDALIAEARVLKLEGIIAHTDRLDIIQRAKEIGFHQVQQQIIALPLK